MDLHLEEFGDFGLGTNEFLRKVRLHADSTLAHDALKRIFDEVKGEHPGQMSFLGRFDLDRSDRELRP